MNHPKDHSLFGLGLPGIAQTSENVSLEFGPSTCIHVSLKSFHHPLDEL